MNAQIVEKLEKELSEPEGFSSYKEVHQWLTNCCDVPVAYRTVHQWTGYWLQGKLKVPRPVSEKQKAGAAEEFKKNSQLSSKSVGEKARAF
jgi:putative transposase